MIRLESSRLKVGRREGGDSGAPIMEKFPEHLPSVTRLEESLVNSSIGTEKSKGSGKKKSLPVVTAVSRFRFGTLLSMRPSRPLLSTIAMMSWVVLPEELVSLGVYGGVRAGGGPSGIEIRRALSFLC